MSTRIHENDKVFYTPNPTFRGKVTRRYYLPANDTHYVYVNYEGPYPLSDWKRLP